MATLTDAMNLEPYQQRFDRIVEKYAAECVGEGYRCSQVELILRVIQAIENGDHESGTPNVELQDFETLLTIMRTWSTEWEHHLVQQYERLQNARLVEFPSPKDIAVGRHIPPEHDLTSYEQQAFAKFKQEEWTAQFVTYGRQFYDSVERFYRHFKDRTDDQQRRGRKRSRLSYTDMQLTYVRLLQHAFDVPTIDDFNKMHYRKFEDESRIQLTLQADERWLHLLHHAGECVLWAVDDVLAPSFCELPDIFHDMNKFYTDIHHRLNPAAHPASLPPDADGSSSDFDEQHSQEETQPLYSHSPHQQDAPVTALLQQLQLMNSDEST